MNNPWDLKDKEDGMKRRPPGFNITLLYWLSVRNTLLQACGRKGNLSVYY